MRDECKKVLMNFVKDLKEANECNNVINIHIKSNVTEFHGTCKQIEFINLLDKEVLINGDTFDISIIFDDCEIKYDEQEIGYEFYNDNMVVNVDFIHYNKQY
jgi:hypothetical protein